MLTVVYFFFHFAKKLSKLDHGLNLMNMFSHKSGADILPGTEVMRDSSTGNATQGTA